MQPFKQYLLKLDKDILGRSLTRARAMQLRRRARDIISSRHVRHMTIAYSKDSAIELARLCDLYGSDKGEIATSGHPYPWASHSYSDLYELMFALRRSDVRRVLECGLGTNNPALASSMGAKGRPGASLRVWRDYFPNAEIVGIDIDGDVLFIEERIATFQCDRRAV